MIPESSVSTDSVLFTEAATAAPSLFNPEPAVRLCKAAISDGADYDAHLILTMPSRGE